MSSLLRGSSGYRFSRFSWLKQVGLVGALIMALYLISDPTFNAYSALQQHEPSARIFRSLLQVNLGLWCVAISVAVFSKIVALSVVEALLFQRDPIVDMTDEEDEEEDEHNQTNISYWKRLFARTKRRYSRAAAYRGVDSKRRQQDASSNDLALTEIDETRDQAEPEEPDERQQAEVDHCRDGDETDGVMRADSSLSIPGSNVPSPAAIVGGALDSIMVILVGLFLFTITATGYMRRQDRQDQVEDEFASDPATESSTTASAWTLVSQIAAPTFPLVMVVYFAVIAVFPWKTKRRHFWSIVARTLWAPIPSPVTFRDGFIGDILTSSVRPLQDLAFTFCYLLFGLKGWWSTAYHYHVEKHHGADGAFENATNTADEVRSFSFIHQADASVPEMEKSWLVHTIVLPTCMISPLWWRFLQNLRQSYDAKARWPYLGNAFKYFLAAQVAMFGIYHPDKRNSAVWIVCFVIATLYQVWWDIFMDWGLFQRNQDGRWGLRSQRLYAKTMVYWAVCTVNVALRFCWILTFLPPRYLNAAGRLTENFGDGLGAVFGPSLASAEILRRSLWGLLRFEWEAIKESSENRSVVATASNDDEPEHGEEEGLEMITATSLSMTPMDMKRDDKADMTQLSFRSPWWRSDMSAMNDIQILGELCVYATVFILIGTLAAAHRETL